MSSRVIRVVAAVIEREGKYLITQRRDEAVLAGLWEFPGGRVDAGESDAAALARELRERLDVDVVVADKVAERRHAYEGYEVHLALYACRLPEGIEPRPRHVKDARWVSSVDFGRYQFPPADQATMDQLLGMK